MGHVTYEGEIRSSNTELVIKSEGKSSLGHTHRWGDSKRMDLKETRRNDVEWVHLT